MKVIPIPAIAILVTIGTLLLTSCEDDTPKTPAPNFEITSSDLITIQETHENGWIKKAERYNTPRTLQYKFTYYPNGFLERYQVYKLTNNANSAILYQEHTRSDTDLPLTSRYYDVAGNLYAELLYEDGLLASKVIHHTGITTTFFYEQGAIRRIEKRHNATDELTLITYTTNAGKRTIEITTAGTAPLTVASIDHTIIQGFDISDDAVLLNLLDDKAQYTITPASVYSSSLSISPELSIDIQELNIDLVEYYELEDDLIQRFGTADEGRKIKNLLIDDWRRSITEQYLFTEGVVLISYSKSIINQYSLGGGLLDDVMQTTKNLRTQYGDDFEQLYGQGYVTRYHHGKYLFTIGTLRNLPTDPTLRTQIKTIAEKRANDLITGQTTVTEEELALLSRVFFQLKSHSNVLDVNGQVIESSAQYKAVEQAVTDAQSPIIHYVLARHFSD